MITLDDAKEQASRRYMNPCQFEEVREGNDLLGWTYVASGPSITPQFGYIAANGEHPHSTESYRSYAENAVRMIMGHFQ